MTDKTESADPLNISIQDIIAEKAIIPHHIELGFATPQKDQLVEVRAIDVPISVITNSGEAIHFDPGSPAGNIECITYSCILLNDLLNVDDIKSLLPKELTTINIELNEWASRLACDDWPPTWFIHYRDHMMLQVHLNINCGKAYDDLYLEAGLEWGDILEQVQHRMQLIELAQGSDMKKQVVKETTDYSSVQSDPAANLKKKKSAANADRDIGNFMKEAEGILDA